MAACVNIYNVGYADDAKPIIEALEGKTYMNFHVAVCPIGGSCEVNVETAHEDVSEEELTGMVLHVLAGKLLGHD